MRRQALLVLGQSINRPNSETVLTAFREFLLSNLGGAWEPGEVAFLDNHSAGYVRGKIESMREADYALVVFRGAGQTVKQNRPWKEMQLSLPAGEIVTERELNPRSPRCLQLFDCAENSMESACSLMRTHHSLSTRSEFDDAILRAESGVAKVQLVTRAENPVSSLMADLMSTAETWAAERQGVLGIGDALTLARSRISSTDVATYSGVRRRGDYPFAANRVS